MNLKDSIGLLVHYAIVILVVKNYSDCIVVDEVIVIMQDNRGKIDLVQKIDVDNAKRLKIGRSIFLIFLQ